MLVVIHVLYALCALLSSIAFFSGGTLWRLAVGVNCNENFLSYGSANYSAAAFHCPAVQRALVLGQRDLNASVLTYTQQRKILLSQFGSDQLVSSVQEQYTYKDWFVESTNRSAGGTNGRLADVDSSRGALAHVGIAYGCGCLHWTTLVFYLLMIVYLNVQEKFESGCFHWS